MKEQLWLQRLQDYKEKNNEILINKVKDNGK